MSKVGDDILQGLKEAVRYRRGELTEAEGVKTHTFAEVPENVDVKAIRTKLGLTQEEFSGFGFSVRSIQNWEGGKRKPEGSARVLLQVISRHPDVVLNSLRDDN